MEREGDDLMISCYMPFNSLASLAQIMATMLEVLEDNTQVYTSPTSLIQHNAFVCVTSRFRSMHWWQSSICIVPFTDHAETEIYSISHPRSCLRSWFHPFFCHPITQRLHRCSLTFSVLPPPANAQYPRSHRTVLGDRE